MDTYTLLSVIFICLAVILLSIRWIWSGIYFTRKYKGKKTENLRTESIFGTLSLLTAIAAAIAIVLYFIGYTLK